MEKRKIILDCDPGHDDAIAMLLAWGSPVIDLVAVTTVAGNQTIEKVTRNALAVARVGNMQGLTIAKGSRRPIIRPETENAPSIHGDSGMDGPRSPKPMHTLDPRSGVQVIIDTIMQNPPKTITLVPTGALTNIALAARVEPRIVERVKEVVLMGGGAHVGNWSACAEFNIKIDPEAAYCVFHEKWPVTMIGLDVTHKALATPAVMADIAALGTKPAKFVCDLIDFFGKMYRKEQGFDAPPVHDACAVAYVIDPTLFTTRRCPIEVELTGTATLGMTVCDFRKLDYPDCSTQVALDIDHGRFWALITDALKRIGQVEF
ncbi:nucleoside hydrolase [Sutterella sp.]|uniref:uridine-preferring nucleoside hydrolase UriH n=1 Tax=Sutterella sp. TaxID=1981025 RepID=UPI0026DFEF8C|nr:nucleoside hydrolase [Sutterella sp.]MDO5531822.1 nucleoside hydrolase [Sutterella sp.]